MRAHRTGLGVLASIAVHAALIGAMAAILPSAPPTKVPRCEAHLTKIVRRAFDAEMRPVIAQIRRRDLVERARALRERGDLKLGAFVLSANAIDAAEEDAGFDFDGAMAKYDARVSELRHALKRESVEVAVSHVFDDFTYTGIPGGRMGDTLLTGTGSCEPLSHLIASAVYDAGHQEVQLRFYGGKSAGVQHIAPVIATKTGEHDLVLGSRSNPGGRAFPADEIVEAYARAHGIGEANKLVAVVDRSGPKPGVCDGCAPGAAGSTSAGVSGLYASFATSTRTMTGGYPANDDKFTGALPLFQSHAVGAVNEAQGDAAEPQAEPPRTAAELANSCATLVRPGELDPPHLDLSGAASSSVTEHASIDLYRPPLESALEKLSNDIASLEEARTAPTTDIARKLVLSGCLAGLYARASVDFALSGDNRVADRANLEIQALQSEMKAPLAALGTDDDAGRKRRSDVLEASGGEAWVLLFLPDSDASVMQLAHEANPLSYDVTTLLTTLLVKPSSRRAALAWIDELPLERQIDVMHELGHAHENTRPWTATFDLELPEGAPPSRFLDIYRVFLPMSWRLWELELTEMATLPRMVTLDTLVDEARTAKLEAGVLRGLVGYYVRYALWLYATRPGGGEVIHNLDVWLHAHGYGSVLDFEEIKPSPIDRATLKKVLDDYESGKTPTLGARVR